ncbi:hypothetical protein SEA_TENNO_40 [Arthrobacter phage Tenno]|uniref:Uncharacterized protein n=1 Tax=Arthrobacter phage Tenno TaxID=2315702 RepID=A0A386KQK7_9CAUD|nr:hypothetical protein SEA_TENNO_40 [Arthrobacter phage Tenno]
MAQFCGTRKNGLARITGAIMRSMYLKWLCARKQFLLVSSFFVRS